MIKPNRTSILPLAMSIFGYLFMSGIFIQALKNPMEHTDFIYNTGMLIYMIEFLNIHSSGMLLGEHLRPHSPRRIALLGFYLIFVFGLLIAGNNRMLVIYFAISLFSKLVVSKSIPKREHVVLSTFLLLSTVIFVSASAGFFEKIAPFPKEFYLHKPDNASGTFIDTPQTILFWGIFYSIGMCFVELLMYSKRKV